MARPAKIESALPFPPYGQFISFLDDLNAMGVLPNVVNASAFKPSYSGSSVSQILRALKFFDLTSEIGVPDEARLKPLMDPATRSLALKGLLESKYASLISLPLATASPQEVNSWFASIGMDSVSTRKAKAFFLSAAKENGIEMHTLVAGNTPRRGPRGKRKSNGKKRDQGADNAAQAHHQPFRPPTKLHPAVQAWIDEMPSAGDPWDRADFENWLSIFRASVERAYKI